MVRRKAEMFEPVTSTSVVTAARRSRIVTYATMSESKDSRRWTSCYKAEALEKLRWTEA